MRKSVRVTSWAVYQSTVLGQPGPNAICTQAEWEAIERGQPGVCRLIRGGITNEGEAERLARGASGEIKPRVSHKKASPAPPGTVPVLAPAPGGETPEDDGPVILPFSCPPEVIKESGPPDGPPDERKESA